MDKVFKYGGPWGTFALETPPLAIVEQQGRRKEDAGTLAVGLLTRAVKDLLWCSDIPSVF